MMDDVIASFFSDLMVLRARGIPQHLDFGLLLLYGSLLQPWVSNAFPRFPYSFSRITRVVDQSSLCLRIICDDGPPSLRDGRNLL
jgi:hypothetical protein